MKFKEIVFKESEAQRVYATYIQRIRNVLNPLTASDREEVLMEFNSHIFEYIQNNPETSQLKNLLDAIDKLGAPEVVLKPLVADKMLDRATRSFNPLYVFKALILNITNGISYIVFAILYLFLGSFIFMILAKLANQEVGMYFKNGEFVALGLVKTTSDYQEVLGYWFIPLMVFAAVVFYMVITLLLRFKKLLNRKN
ncbi:HAAS signaling domain-containing protein [Leeuwenhoekiella marinoflava]|uniref:HAAS signaling domain-containing protein n=1 Tax=Leeuwenhoekiella marinoflava TaxID=988 RepID=UPI003002A782